MIRSRSKEVSEIFVWVPIAGQGSYLPGSDHDRHLGAPIPDTLFN